MNHLDLFSGIGGFSLAVDTVWPGSTHTFCEIDPFCQKVLLKHWPGAKIYGDIHTITNNQPFDIVTGGFPCQPFSSAGLRQGTKDPRYLWPEMLRVIQLIKPAWVIGENVGGLVNWNDGMVLEKICVDLENEGYEVQPFIIPACAVDAIHRRDRVWILAHSNRPDGQRSIKQEKIHQQQTGTISVPFLQKTRKGLLPESVLCRANDGIPDKLDRTRALGNAIVPQVAIEIMKAIKLTMESNEPQNRSKD